MIPSIAKHVICQCALATVVLAGTPAPKAPPSVAISPTVDPWEITVTPYGWMAGLEGTTGIKGFTVETDVPFKDILSNLDMVAMLNIEARKGRWGGWVDGLYLKMGAGADPSGPLFNSVGLSIEQVIAEAAVFYRVMEGKRGYLDVYAGARYMSVSGDLSLDVSDSGLEQVSNQISERVVNDVVSAVKKETDAALASARSKIASKVTTRVREDVSAIVSEKVTKVESTINDLRQIAAAYPALVEVIRNSSRLQTAIRNVAEARIDEKLAEAQQTAANASAAAEAVRAAAQAAVDQARSRARKAVAKAEKKLASEIADALQDAIPSEISGSESWVDPFVGFRACYNFTDRLYAITKADIGGFGISSDLIWQAYGALGYHLTKSGKTTVELGYKYMAVDYTSGGFTYDVSMSGLMLNLGMKF